MSKIATVLKEEIARLSRKEANAATAVLRRASAQYRRDIARLKREVARLTRQVAYLGQRERKRVAEGPSRASTEGRRFSPRGLRSRREQLGISAADYARLVGVSTQTIYNWERGRSRPQDEQLASLVAIRALGKREVMKRLELLKG